MSAEWYPVINEETCIECSACIKNCPNGVFDDKSPEKPVVFYPEGCIYQCHSCGDLCPTGSITYAGDDTGWTPPNKKNVK